MTWKKLLKRKLTKFYLKSQKVWRLIEDTIPSQLSIYDIVWFPKISSVICQLTGPLIVIIDNHKFGYIHMYNCMVETKLQPFCSLGTLGQAGHVTDKLPVSPTLIWLVSCFWHLWAKYLGHVAQLGDSPNPLQSAKRTCKCLSMAELMALLWIGLPLHVQDSLSLKQ